MNTLKRATASDQRAGEIQLARIRLAKAESQLELAKDQARAARRRRKEAKQAARRARKQARLAKREFAQAKLALAEAEATFALAGRPTARTTTRKRPAAKPAVAPVREKVARPAASPAPESVKSMRLAPGTAKPRSHVRPRVRAAKPPVAVPVDFETLGATSSVPTGTATVLMGGGLGEPRADESEARKSVDPSPSENQGQ